MVKKQADKNEIVLTNAMLRKITETASKVGIECYKKESERVRKEFHSKKLHNTKLLLQKYRWFVAHSDSAVSDALQVEDDYDLKAIMDMMSPGIGNYNLTITSIKESAARTRVILHHIDKMLDYYKYQCQTSGRPEIERRYDTVKGLYLDEKQKSAMDLADEFYVDVSTVYKYNRAAIQDLSALFFGCIDD